MGHSPHVNPEVDSTGSLERGPISKKDRIRIGRNVLSLETEHHFHTSSNIDIAIAIVRALRSAVTFNMVILPSPDISEED